MFEITLFFLFWLILCKRLPDIIVKEFVRFGQNTPWKSATCAWSSEVTLQFRDNKTNKELRLTLLHHALCRPAFMGMNSQKISWKQQIVDVSTRGATSSSFRGGKFSWTFIRWRHRVCSTAIQLFRKRSQIKFSSQHFRKWELFIFNQARN